MQHRASLSLTSEVQRELRHLDFIGILEPLDNEFSPGILRGVNGNKDARLLNAMLPRARFKPILASRVLMDTLVEFDIKAAEILGTERYMVKGYAGKTHANGALTYLHAHHGMKGVVNAVIAGTEGPSATTMFYTGTESAEPFEDKPMTEAIEGLGIDNFAQLDQGQIAHFGETDFHGEPPHTVLPVGTPRMLLVAYAYE